MRGIRRRGPGSLSPPHQTAAIHRPGASSPATQQNLTPPQQPPPATALFAGSPDSSVAAILDLWQAIELFCPQPVASPKESRRDQPVSEWKPGLAAPWEPGHELARRRPPGVHSEWRPTVFPGVYDLRLAIDQLEARFGKGLRFERRAAPGTA